MIDYSTLRTSIASQTGLKGYNPGEDRDGRGRWTAGGSSAIVEVDRDGSGLVKNNTYAGVTDNEWQDWAYFSHEVNDAAAGTLKVGDLDSAGQRITQEEVDQYKDLATRIQAAAESNYLSGTFAVFRGESYPTMEEAKARYSRNNLITFGELTSTTTDIEAAKDYAKAGDAVHVLLAYQQGGGLQGIQTAPLGVPSNEFVLPKGGSFRVTRTRSAGNTLVVELYQKKAPKGQPVVDRYATENGTWYNGTDGLLQTIGGKSLSYASLLKSITDRVAVKGFDPSERRDRNGRWVSGGAGDPSKMDPETYAAYIAAMPPAKRDDVEWYENARGYTLYEARKLMPKTEEGAFKKVTDANSFMLWRDSTHVANVGGKPWLLSKQEDPDEPDEFPKRFVWSFSPAHDYTTSIDTMVADPGELRAEIRKYDAEHGNRKSYSVLLKSITDRAEAFKSAHKFSSTQLNLNGKLGKGILDLADTIPDKVLAPDGRESTPHITLKYGLHTQDPEEVAALLKDEPPIRVRIGDMHAFFGEENDMPHDVLKLNIESPDLHRLNQKLSDNLDHTTTQTEYRPHATLAYVKRGTAKKFVGQPHALKGKEAVISRVTFSSKDGGITAIPLGGKLPE